MDLPATHFPWRRLLTLCCLGIDFEPGYSFQRNWNKFFGRLSYYILYVRLFVLVFEYTAVQMVTVTSIRSHLRKNACIERNSLISKSHWKISYFMWLILIRYTKAQIVYTIDFFEGTGWSQSMDHLSTFTLFISTIILFISWSEFDLIKSLFHSIWPTFDTLH